MHAFQYPVSSDLMAYQLIFESSPYHHLLPPQTETISFKNLVSLTRMQIETKILEALPLLEHGGNA